MKKTGYFSVQRFIQYMRFEFAGPNELNIETTMYEVLSTKLSYIASQRIFKLYIYLFIVSTFLLLFDQSEWNLEIIRHLSSAQAQYLNSC